MKKIRREKEEEEEEEETSFGHATRNPGNRLLSFDLPYFVVVGRCRSVPSFLLVLLLASFPDPFLFIKKKKKDRRRGRSAYLIKKGKVGLQTAEVFEDIWSIKIISAHL